MVIIQFQNGADWYKANWVFRQLAEDTVTAFPHDHALRTTLEKAAAFGALFLDSMEAGAAASTMAALKCVAQRTIEGAIPGWKRSRPEDDDMQQMYLQAVTELLDLLVKAGA